jgi:hypothetical protein
MKRSLLMLLGGLVLLAAILLVRDMVGLGKHKTAYAFDTTLVSTITRMHVSMQGEEVTLIKTVEGWQVLPDSFPADTARIALALRHLTRLEDRELVSRSTDPMRLAEFGLSPEEVKIVTLTEGSGNRFIIHLGHTSGVDFNSTFWKHPDRIEVYRTSGNFTHEISINQLDWFAPDSTSQSESKSDAPFQAIPAFE